MQIFFHSSAKNRLKISRYSILTMSKYAPFGLKKFSTLRDYPSLEAQAPKPLPRKRDYKRGNRSRVNTFGLDPAIVE